MKFSEIQLHPQLQANLDKIKFVEGTKIQEQALPLIRAGKDVAGLAQTGTGKTGAFFIPLMDRLLKAMHPDESTAGSETLAFPEWKKKQFILVLVPTRELCEQVQDISTKLLEGTGIKSVSIYGGTTYDKQVAALKDGVEFVVATPGRLIDLYKEHVCDLGLVRAIVFDEADRMFDMGFKDDMKFILKRVPRDRQFTVFSATLNFDVMNVAYEFGSDPVEINISRDQAKAENVKDNIVHLGQADKPAYLLSLIKKINPKQVIIFSNFKHNVERITKFLTANGVPAVGISSLITQAQRNRVMEQFKGENDRNILVATDVAARGLDILGVDLVINFDLPDDAENYVHRIGRTGRAGQTGTALSLVSDRDVDALGRIEEYLKHKVEVFWLDDADVLKEMEPFPRDEGRFKKPGQGRPSSGGGGYEKRGSSGGGGGRSGGGGDRDRGPRRERPSGDRDRDRGRDRDSGPRRERPPRDREPLAANAAGGPDGGASAGVGGARRETHRDHRTGRHRNASGEPRSQDSVAGNGPGPRGPNSRSEGSRGRGPNAHRSRPQGNGGAQNGAPSSGGPRSDSRRPQAEGRRADSRPRRPGQPFRPQQNKTTARPGARPAGQAGIGAKVTGFFKKLFGG